MGKRRYIFIALATLLMGLVKPVMLHAQVTISSPTLHCIAVDSVGDVTLTWTIPADTDNTFKSYDIYVSNNLAGPYTLQTSVFSKTQSTLTINGMGANAAPLYFYMLTNTTNGTSTNGNTLESIFLTVTNPGSGTAILSWNAMCNPNLPSFNGWYKIYMEYPKYVWKLIDSTQALRFVDTIKICSATLNFKIVTSDASGCQSVSNIEGGTFANLIPPNPPVMDTVSVSPANSIDISWGKSNSTDVTGYVIYEYIGAAWVAIDTVKGINSSFFNFTGGNPSAGSLSFRVAALDSCKNVSAQAPAQATLFLNQMHEECVHRDSLYWNKYVNLLPGVQEYKIYASIAAAPYKVIGTSTSTSFVDKGLNTPQTICYYVQVVDSLNPTVTATSNVICYTVTLPPPPKFAYLNNATVVNNSKVQVDGYMDTHAGIRNYIFNRASAPGGKFTPIASVPVPMPLSQHISFFDPTANPNLQSYTYYIVSEDSCNYYIDTTNIGQTMFLTAVGTNTGLDTLTWNDYQWWKGTVTHYDIYRNEDDGAFSYLTTVPYTASGTNVYVDNVSQIIQGEGIFCYYIQAIEGNNGYGFVDTSTSNSACAYQDPRVYIPNAFNPRGVNEIFVPIGVFVNLQSYDFSIFNRWGQLLFEATQPGIGWNGTYGGHTVEEGVYVYRLQYTSSKGEYFDNKGTVILLK